MNPERLLKILFISDSGPGTVGGAEASLYHLIEALRRRGHTVVRAYAEHGPSASPASDYQLNLPQPRTRFRLPRPGFMREAYNGLQQLRGVLASVRPEITVLHFVTPRAGYLLALRRLFGYRVLLSARGSDLLRPHQAYAWMLPYVLRRADGVLALSEALADAAVALAGIPRPSVVYNGVDTAFWSPDIVVSGHLDERPPMVVSVGRLEWVKGHDVLIEAFARLRARVPEARLLIIGDGSERGALEDRAFALGLGAAVEFAGALEPVAVRERLRAADVFVLPSRSEGLSNALLEALGTGLPAVASEVGGVPEVMAGGGGILVQPEDPVVLADTLADLLIDPAKRHVLGTAARINALAWSWEAAAVKFERAAFEAMK